MKFRIANIVLVLAIGILAALRFFVVPLRWWCFAAVLLAYVAIVFLGCIHLSWNFFTNSLCRAKTGGKFVALTFDDGPHPVHTPAVLDVLEKNNVKAAFFCIGKNIRGNEPLLKRAAEEGHLVGNHSYSHGFWFDLGGSEKMLADMRLMDNAVISATGLAPAIFRPPYGVMNPNLARAVKKGGYTSIGWSIRSFDTAIADRNKLLSRITGKLKSGDIILLHDTLPQTAEILQELIDKINSKGYTIKKPDELLHIKAYA